MMKLRVAAATLAAMTLASASAAEAPRAPQVPAAPAPKVSLRGSFVYIYTFLDVREDEFGLEVIEEFDRQIVSRFDAEGVKSKVLRFSRTPFGRRFVANIYNPENILVPYGKVMADNR